MPESGDSMFGRSFCSRLLVLLAQPEAALLKTFGLWRKIMSKLRALRLALLHMLVILKDVAL